jgi:hypothetical protein
MTEASARSQPTVRSSPVRLATSTPRWRRPLPPRRSDPNRVVEVVVRAAGSAVSDEPADSGPASGPSP